jgi:hypothetical protein
MSRIVPASALGADQGGRAHAPSRIPASSGPHDGRQPSAAATPDHFGIEQLEVRERHDRRNGMTGPLDDDSLAGRGFIDDLPEPGPDVEGAD